MKVQLTVGCPGAGKTTWALAQRNAHVLSLDDFRIALFGSKSGYWLDIDANLWRRRILHRVWREALSATALEFRQAEINGDKTPTLILANTHLTPAIFETDVKLLRGFGARVALKVFDTPIEELLHRNAKRDAADQMDPDILRRYHAAFTAEDAWWRSHAHDLIPVHLSHKDV